jgi:hypothetical protein
MDDPSQPSYVRELLEAGRGARVRGYDFNQGLATHLSRVESGAPMPDWAKGMQPGAAVTIGSLTAGARIAGLLAVPVVTAAVVAAVMLASQPATTPAVTATAVPAAMPASIATGEPQVVGSAAPTSVAVSPAAQERGQHSKRAMVLAPHKASLARSPAAQPVLGASSIPGGRAVSTDAVHTEATIKPAHGGATLDGDPFASARPAGVTGATGEAPPAAAEPREQATAAREPVVPQSLDDARLEREMAMLAMAERVLRSNPERALKLVQQGEAEFQGSMFTQERQQLLLLSLVELGRLDEARRMAKPYLARFPHGPFSDRVRRALASGTVER